MKPIKTFIPNIAGFFNNFFDNYLLYQTQELMCCQCHGGKLPIQYHSKMCKFCHAHRKNSYMEEIFTRQQLQQYAKNAFQCTSLFAIMYMSFTLVRTFLSPCTFCLPKTSEYYFQNLLAYGAVICFIFQLGIHTWLYIKHDHKLPNMDESRELHTCKYECKCNVCNVINSVRNDGKLRYSWYKMIKNRKPLPVIASRRQTCPKLPSKDNRGLEISIIRNERSLREYLREYHKKNVMFSQSDISTINSLPRYQLSSGISRKITPRESNYLKSTCKPSINHLETNISCDRRWQSIVNLRSWLANTIIKPLCEEIDSINKFFRDSGFADFQVGQISLTALQSSLNECVQIEKCVPNLVLIYSYLSVCENQEYLVERLKQLASGACLANYEAHATGSSNFLPNDAAVVFHAFCVYMDCQLWPKQGSKRPFFDEYVVVGNSKLLENRTKCAIFCTHKLQPRFHFAVNNFIDDCGIPDNSSSSNLFNIILQFLIYLRRNSGNMLEDVRLDLSGINISWVIDDLV